MSNELEKIAYVYGDVCLRKQRRKRQKLLIAELFLDYAKNSTLHGLRYIAEKGLTTIEKLFWTVTFIVSIILCSILIKNVYIKWKYSPVIVTVNERLVSVAEVPFPSVTICPQIKSKASVYNFREKYSNMSILMANKNQTLLQLRDQIKTDEDFQMFADISMLCSFQGRYREFTNASIIKHIDYVAPNSSDVLLSCKWNEIELKCNEMFKKVYTAEGLCFNMNGLAAGEMFRDTVQSEYRYSERNRSSAGWSFEKGYSDTKVPSFPERGKHTTNKPDLEVILVSRDEDKDGICNGMNSGYRIYIQHPADFPQSSTYYYAAVDGQVSSLALSFQLLGASETLRNIPSAIRQCYFSEERSLRYFKIYTAQNCRVECLSNYTFRECECVGYYMPHDNSSQICAEDKLDCIKNAHRVMTNEELHLELTKSDSGCQCLPSCKTVDYDAEILKTDYSLKKYASNMYNLSDSHLSATHFSKIEMYFKKPQFISMYRSELFGNTDFLANIGGLLGLFLGFSFLSLIELFYFITLRVGYTLRRDLKEEKINRTNTVKIEKESSKY